MNNLPLSSAAKNASPLQKKERIIFLDAIRGIAVLGILIMNIMGQGQSEVFYNNMDLSQPITGPNFYAWAIEMGVFEGTMRGLFSILFGAGTILLLARLEKTRAHLDVADIYYRRMIWLLVFGLINAYIFLWPGDILYYYALCGLFLFPFRKLSAQKLFLCALILLLIGTYRETSALYDRKETISKGKTAEMLQKNKRKLTEEQTGELKAWQELNEKHSSKGLMKQAEEETKKIQEASYPQIFAHYRDANMEMESKGLFNSWWDMLLFFFLGMALFKSGFLTGDSKTWIYLLVTVAGIALGLWINYAELKTLYLLRFDEVKMIEKTTGAYYQVRRLVQTMGYLSLLILLYKVNPLKWIFRIFVPVGQMAFSNYLGQSIITSVIFLGFGWYGKLQRYQIYEIATGIWIFQIVFSHIWLKFFIFGPFEWAWRSLTYQKIQPFKRAESEDVLPDFSTAHA